MIPNKSANNIYWKKLKVASLTNGAGKTGYSHEARFLFLTLHQNQLKMNQKP
jgi:hypothetical protein